MATGFQATQKHWRGVAANFLFDFFLVWIAFLGGVWFRFGDVDPAGLSRYLPGICVASFFMPCVLYVGGFYSGTGPGGDVFSRLRWFVGALISVLGATLIMGSIDFSSRIGRGVLVASIILLAALLCVRHWRSLFLTSRRWGEVYCLVSSKEDELGALLLQDFWKDRIRFVRVIAAKAYIPSTDLPVWKLSEFSLSGVENISFLLVRDRHLSDPDLGSTLRKLRYQGLEIVSLADACEEAYQAVPLELVSDSWLFRACNQSGLIYIKKFKRLFDIVCSLVFMLLLSPALLLGMFTVRLSSPGPIFFRQVRAGRLERPITVTKLRTMHVEDEQENKKAPKWAESETSRIFPSGHWLRKFRVDEIPQLWQVFRGDLSFVGPRPEQVGLVNQLAREIPFYRERLLIQPGLTGWAQVRYPYGSSVEDAARKLEYDLYYMKHMSLFLDFFILIETVKIILTGGVKKGSDSGFQDMRKALVQGAIGNHTMISEAGLTRNSGTEGTQRSNRPSSALS